MNVLRGGQYLIRDHKLRVPVVIAVLQRSAHKLYLVLVPRDLRQKAAARADHRHGDDREFLYGRVRQRNDPFKRVFLVGFFIQHQQIVHAVNLMPALRQPRGKDRMLFRLPDRAGVQNFNFNSFDRVFPP